MPEERAQRRLAAILAADVVGYSRLMQADEAGTLAALKTRRTEVLQPVVAKHRGRVVKLMGDGVLIEFASAVDAVECAVQLQQAMQSANAGVPEEMRIVLRIGINLGDVMVEGGDLYGDGVNVAARLEALAEPGGVLISQTVHGQVRGKVPLAFEDRGERQLKNMAEPVRVYQVSGDLAPDAAVALGQPDTKKPSIAVLPFTNMSGDPAQEYFSDGITEDIITELSRFHSLLVIARNSSFSYKGRSPRIQDVGRELGVQYVLEGSVRRAGAALRVTAQLVETSSGTHLWAERFDRDAGSIFAVQDEIVSTIVSTLVGRIDEASKSQVRALAAPSLRAYDLYLRALNAQDDNTKQSYQEAEQYLQQALLLDRNYSQAHFHLSLVRFVQWMAYWVEDREYTFAESFASAERALALDTTNSSLHAHYGILLMYHRPDEAREHFDKAVQLNPNDAKAMALYGYFLTSVHEVENALVQFDKAGQLNPLAPNWTNWLKGITYYTARRYPDAIRALRSIRSPMNEVRGWLAASYAQAGKIDLARSTLETFLNTAEAEMVPCPPRQLDAWKSFWHGAIPYADADDTDHLLDGLHKAGMPS